MKKYLLNFVLIFGMSLMVVTSVIPINSQTAHAAAVDSAKIDAKAKSYIYLQAFTTCMAGNSLSSYSNQNLNNQWIDPDQAIAGSFFASRSNSPLTNPNLSAFDISLGYLNGNKLGCGESSWIQDALRFWGWTDNVEALNDFGFTTNNEGDYIPPDNRQQKFFDAVISKYYGSASNYTKDQNAVNYYLYSQAFKQICGATSVGPKEGASASNLALINTDNGYVLTEVNSSYNLEEIIFKANLGKGAKIDVYQGEYISCIDAVNKANQFAAAYAQYMNKNKDKEDEPSTTPAGASGTDGELVDNTAACDKALSPFGWVLCPIINLADNVYNFFVGLVRQALFFEPDKYSDSQLQEVTRIFVGFANIALVIFALLMIASQIFGFEVFSAYTVKKVLPKILIGAVLIQLSWPIFTLIIQFVNALGTGLYWLMMAPFDVGGSGYVEIGTILGSGTTSSTGTGSNAAGLTLGLGVFAAGAFGIALTGTWLTIILAALGVLVSLIVAILTLVVREIVLILLLAVAPLALALWIFPGTQKYWNIWWQSYIKLLLMYPLIMGLLAAGSIAAIILVDSSNVQNGIDLNKIFAIVAYFAPLFLIGATYKFAGQAFGSIATMSNKFGSRAGNSGFFGLRDRSKIARENSEWSLGKKRRDSARGLQYQQKYANKLAGSGNKFTKQMSGISEESRARAIANATAAVAQEESQQYKDEATMAQYNINRMAKQTGVALKGEGWDYKTVNGQQVATGLSDAQKIQKWDGMTEYERREQVRRQIMASKGQDSVTVGGQTVDMSESLVAQTALQSLANKDDYEDLRTYVSSSEGGKALNDLGTRDGEAYGILAKRAPSIAKGHGSVLGSPPLDANGNPTNPLQQRGFDDAITGFGDLGAAQREEVLTTLTREYAAQPDEVVARLTELARHSNASATNLEQVDKMFKAAGLPAPDLAALKSNPNGLLTKDLKIIESSAASHTNAPKITFSTTPQSGGNPVTLAPIDVRNQINNNGFQGLSGDDVWNIYNHANTNWQNDTEGLRIGQEAEAELRRRGILPPSP